MTSNRSYGIRNSYTLEAFAVFECTVANLRYTIAQTNTFEASVMLGATTGGISYILNTLRSFCLGSKHAFLKSKWMCWIICILQVMTLYLTWGGWASVLPVAANIASTIGGYTHNARKIRAAGMFINSPLWIIYDVIVGSWAGILDELVSEASMILSVYRYGWKNLDVIEE